ncbi:hypothetical protein GDO86_012235 [Hymenochirus boettgeri]|uniref:Ig-like domain-containing protein n=1 Tax=Hymenochirus boettgeri TaxID=247094 RepID=A0A8T2IRW2_9PIPI|nr:hypothetical protein GDO86_012235 [Hymenochirus boettgeri]
MLRYSRYSITAMMVTLWQMPGGACLENVNSQWNKKGPCFAIQTLKSVTVQRGLCVQIPCTFIIDTYRYTLTRDAVGIWYKGDGQSSVAASNNPSLVSVQTKGRFTLTGNVSGGDCSLSITDKLIAGEQVTLTCTAPGHCPGTSPTFTWKGNINPDHVQDYELLMKDDNITDQSNFTFTPSQKDHNTELTCTENTTVCVLEGNSTSIQCDVSSNPKADITWSKEGVIVTNGSNTQSLTLGLHNVSQFDAATYRCSAKNPLGTVNSTVRVSVEYPPKHTIICVNKSEDCPMLHNYSIPVGSLLSLLCTVKSNPPASVLWTRPDHYNMTNNDGLLLMHNVTSSNNGEYICRAQNKHGQSHSSIIIYITGDRHERDLQTFLVSGICLTLILILLTTIIFLTRWRRKKKLLQEDTRVVTSENDYGIIYSNVETSNNGHPDLDKRDDSALVYMNYEEELKYATLDFSKTKPKAAPQTEEVEYSEVIRK